MEFKTNVIGRYIYLKMIIVNNPGSLTNIRENVSPQCEGYFKKKYDIRSHLTPGVNSVTKNNNTSFCKKDGIRKNIFKNNTNGKKK